MSAINLNALMILGDLEDISRDVGISEMARRTGIERTHFYRVFRAGYGKPSLDSICRIANAAGFRMELVRERKR